MSAVTITFARCARRDGQVFIGFAGTKHGLSYGSVAELREAVKNAYEKDRMHQMLLKIGALLLANPAMTIADLNGQSFTADNGND